MEDPNIPVIQEQTSRFKFLGKVKENPIIAIFVIFAFLGSGAIIASQTKLNPSNQDKKETPKDSTEFISNHSIVYGFWADNKSVISVADLSTNTTAELTRLPINVKHVKIIDSNNIIYISDTDDKDYGKKIIIKTINSGGEKTVFEAENKFGIDDYVISSDKKKVAVWVVSQSEAGTLLGGTSRVYSLNIQTNQTSLIYNERSLPGVPVNYPIAITDSGEVFTDKFLPNSGAGWGYGMSVSNFTGTAKESISDMANGTISSQPLVSPDGKKLVFAGYDGSKGPGTEDLSGFRRALSIPNTIELFDLTSRQRKVLLREVDGFFTSVEWDPSGSENLIYGLMSTKKEAIGGYIYNLSSFSGTKIKPSGERRAFASLPDETMLFFEESINPSSLGNLGGKYNSSINAMFIVNSDKEFKLRANDSFMQFIAMTGKDYFTSLKNSSESKKQLQLYTFELKPSLAPKRVIQQSNIPPPPDKPKEVQKPLCYEVALAQCNQLHGTSVGVKDLTAEKLTNSTLWQCYKPLWDDLTQTVGPFSSNPTCFDSPLYLYGSEGKSVKVDIGTPIYGTNTNYRSDSGFSVTLGKDGEFTANGKKVSSLEFDYEPSIKVSKPSNGYIVSRSEIDETVKKIAGGLGLSEKETSDTLASIKSKTTSPYVFISIYDDKTSKKILPIFFSPNPDNYRNIVFYIENLDSKSLASIPPLQLEKIARGGFTAVEISFIVK